eukprot:scaffold917_cov168-Ochromonas_danica.AAC.25
MAPTKFLVVRYSKTLEFRKPEKCVVIAAAPAPEHCCGDFLGLRSILAAVSSRYGAYCFRREGFTTIALVRIGDKLALSFSRNAEKSS